jgi:hypothetical protein
MHLAKWVLPSALFICVAAWQVISNPPRSAMDLWTHAIIPLCILGGIFIFFLRRDLWGLADTVFDGGDHLVVTLNRKTCEIPVADIEKVDVSHRLNTATVILTLVKPCLFGSRVSFLARASHGGVGSNAVATELAERVARMRGRK